MSRSGTPSGTQPRSLIDRIFSRSRDQTNSNSDGHNVESLEQEVRRITEEKKAVEAQLGLTQDKLHREQERASNLEVEHLRQAVELREANVARETCENDRRRLENDQRRLEDQLRRKEEDLRIQEEELAKLKSDYRHQGMELTEARELLASSQNRLREANDNNMDLKRSWTESEAHFNLERRAYKKLTSKHEELERKFAALNQENDNLHERIRQLSKVVRPPVMSKLSRNANPQHVSKKHECWKMSAVELLRTYDDLLCEMASNLSPSSIGSSTSDWIHLCAQLQVNSESLSHVEPKERLITIIQQHEQQTNGRVMTVKVLCKTLKSIQARRAASLLVGKAYDVYEQHKRIKPRATTVSYGLRQDYYISDSLSDSEAEADSQNVTAVPVTATHSTLHMSYNDSEAVEFSDIESPRHV